MKKIIFIFLFLILGIFVLNKIVFSDVSEETKTEQNTEIKKYIHPIKSISFENTNYSDLKIFDSILKDNQVILLGENTHSDGQTFKAKSRLVRYLHEKLGYNVVLYEAGQYDTWLMNEEMKTNALKVPKDSIGGIGLFHFWWSNSETKPLISYYQSQKKTTNPIEIGGFDIQFSGNELNGKRRREELTNYLAKNKIDLKKFPVLNKNMRNLEQLVYGWFVEKNVDQKQQKQLLDELSTIEKLINSFEKTEENTIYSRYFNDIRNNYFKSWNYESGKMKSMNFRDSLMAKNLIYQLDSVYRNQKVIVWCSNIHTFSDRYNKDYLPLGSYIKKKYGSKSYMLDFSSFGYKVENAIAETPGKLSIENRFHDMKIPYFFLDLRSIPNQSFLKKDFNSTINQGFNEKRNWSKTIDGIFYIDINQEPTYQKQ